METIETDLDRIGEPKPWAATLMSLIVMGLGFAYVGRPWLAALVPAAGTFVVLGVLAASVALHTALFPAVVSALVVVGGGQIAQAVWAGRLARGAIVPPGTRVQRYFPFIVWAIASAILASVFRTNVVESFHSPSGSMLPTIEVGDSFFVAKMDSQRAGIRPGAVVVFHVPNEPEQVHVKRVVGLPGDRIEIRRGRLYVNGAGVPYVALGRGTFLDREGVSGPWHPFEAGYGEETLGGRKYRTLTTAASGASVPDFGPQTISEGYFFVLGDNRAQSLDSRALGPIPFENYIGRADSLYWSWGPEGLRSERLGLRL